jgi:transcriptional regulator with XRE-family HTH domain
MDGNELDGIVGRNVRKIREDCELTLLQVSAAMTANSGGKRWTPAILSRLETGGRRVGLDDLVLLANTTSAQVRSASQLAPQDQGQTEGFELRFVLDVGWDGHGATPPRRVCRRGQMSAADVRLTRDR